MVAKYVLYGILLTFSAILLIPHSFAITYQDPIFIPTEGSAVSFEGNMFAIGNQLYDIQGNNIRTFVNPNQGDGSNWGNSVDIDGNQILIGNRGDNTLELNSGAAFLFDIISGDLLQTFYPSDAVLFEKNFGFSVALSDDKAIIAAVGDLNVVPEPTPGSVYIFDTTSGSLLHKLSSPRGNDYQFGWCVDAEDDKAIIAQVRGVNFGSGIDPEAYLFDITDGSHLQTYSENIGASVSISNDRILITQSSGNNPEGYLYDTSGNLEIILQKPFYYNSVSYCESDDLDGDLILLGAPGDGLDGFLEAGSVSLYDTSGNLLNYLPNPNPESEDKFGVVVQLSDSNLLIGTGHNGEDGFLLYLKEPTEPHTHEDLLTQIQDILESILGLDTRVSELEDRVAELEEQIENMIPSDDIPPVVVANPTSGTFVNSVDVTLSATDNVDPTPTIHYTTDGSTPTTGSALYTVPIPITSDTSLKFIAVDSSGNDSPVSTENYDIIGPIPVNLTVRAIDSNGNTRSLWTVLRLNGNIIDTGFTPQSNQITAGTVYTVFVSNYNQFTFDRWEDGSTANPRTFSIVSDKTLTAFFNAP